MRTNPILTILNCWKIDSPMVGVARNSWRQKMFSTMKRKFDYNFIHYHSGNISVLQIEQLISTIFIRLALGSVFSWIIVPIYFRKVSNQKTNSILLKVVLNTMSNLIWNFFLKVKVQMEDNKWHEDNGKVFPVVINLLSKVDATK